MSKDNPVTTVRLGKERHERIMLVARVTEQTFTDIFIEAIDEYLAKRLNKEFKARLAERIEEDKKILDQL